MKILDIALKDVIHSFRSVSALFFMFGIPLLITTMFYIMFGSAAEEGSFDLPRIQVAIANMDEGGTRLHFGGKNSPGGFDADSLGELVIDILQSEEIADLIAVELVPDPAAARQAVDDQKVGVALIIPTDFSHQFMDPNGEAIIEFYQDPTLTIGPGIVKSLLSQFMDGIAGINIATDIAMDQEEILGVPLTGMVVQRYLETALLQEEDLSDAMLEVYAPGEAPVEDVNPVLQIVGPIMIGMMIFYAFFTGTNAAQSILREEEERTLPRLFTTPTSPVAILTGKLLAVFLTVIVQVTVLLLAANLIFGVKFREARSIAVAEIGVVLIASSAGIFINSLMKSTSQSGVIFGGIMTVTGMVGMISIFTMNSGGGGGAADIISLLVPQGWAIRGVLQAMDGEPFQEVLLTTFVMLAWAAVFFVVGVRRFQKRYV